MADTDVKTRKNDHSSEEDWFDFARQQAAPAVRARLEQHLEKGCSRCTQTVRLWRVVLDVADQEAAYRPPDEALRQLKGDFALRRPKGLLERVAEQAALVFDSFRQPQPAGVRTAGAAPRQLLYKAGRYSIRLRLEPGTDAERLSIVGQLVDEQHSPAAVQDIAGIAASGDKIVRTKSLDGLPIIKFVCALLGCQVLGSLDILPGSTAPSSLFLVRGLIDNTVSFLLSLLGLASIERDLPVAVKQDDSWASSQA